MRDRIFIMGARTDGEQRLAANSLMTMAAYAVYAACLWGMLIAATKLAEAEAVGQFALGLSISTPILMFCNMQLRAAQVTDVSSRFKAGEYLALRLVSTAAAACAIALVAVAISGFSGASAVIAAVGLGKCFEAVGDNLQGLFQQSNHMEWFSLSLLLKSILSLLSFVLTLAGTHDIALASLMSAAVIAAVTLAYDLPRVQRLTGTVLRPTWNLVRLSALAHSALPLGIAALLSAGVAQIPKYAVTYYCGTREFAVFAAVGYFVSGAQILASAMSQAALPRLSAQWFHGNRFEFRSSLLSMMALTGAAALIGLAISAVAGRQILTFLYRAEYAVHTGLLQIIMVGLGVLSIAWILTNALQAAGLFREQMIVFAAGSLSTLMGAAARVPRYQLRGAAIAMLIGAGVQAVSSAVLLWSGAAQVAAMPTASRSR
jgi:O-antigen/teichoic acid export membrane protein